jgi:hypothetical protein
MKLCFATLGLNQNAYLMMEALARSYIIFFSKFENPDLLHMRKLK